MRYYEIIKEARMGLKDLEKISSNDLTFGFELEISAPLPSYDDIKDIIPPRSFEMMLKYVIDDFEKDYKFSRFSFSDIENNILYKKYENDPTDDNINNLYSFLKNIGYEGNSSSDYMSPIEYINYFINMQNMIERDYLYTDSEKTRIMHDGYIRTEEDVKKYFNNSEEIINEIKNRIVKNNIINNFSFDNFKRKLQRRLKKYNLTGWKVVHDGSIDPPGAELVSPIYKGSNSALSALKTAFEMISEYPTNKSTGLHVNIGTFKTDQIDLLKLILFSGQNHVLQTFDRMSNTFTKSNLNDITGYNIDTNDYKKFIERMNVLIVYEANKYKFFNFKKLEEGYIEIRGLGGPNYQHRYPEIENSIKRFIKIFEIALDPMSHREEYLKKLSLFNKKDDIVYEDIYQNFKNSLIKNGADEKKIVNAFHSVNNIKNALTLYTFFKYSLEYGRINEENISNSTKLSMKIIANKVLKTPLSKINKEEIYKEINYDSANSNTKNDFDMISDILGIR